MNKKEEQIRKLSDEFVKKFGDKAVWQVDTFVLKLVQEAVALGH